MKTKNQVLKSTYLITELLYEDIISYCYRGKHIKTRKDILIWKYKVDCSNSVLIKRLIIRCETLIKIRHPQLITMKDYLFNGSDFYTIHEFVSNIKPLDTYLKPLTTWPLKKLWSFSKQLLSLLVVLEHHQLHCGSISLSNIHIDGQGKLRVIHTAIGIEVLLSLWDDAPIIEECLFLAPEVIHKQQFSVASDIYSLGVLFYFFFSQKWPYPFTMDINEYKPLLVNGPTPFNKQSLHIPDRLERLIMTCLQSDLSKRFSTIEMLINSYKGIHPMSIPSDTHPSRIQLEIAKEIKEKKEHSVKKNIRQGISALLIAITIGIIVTLYYGYTRSIPNQAIPNVIGMPQEQAFIVLNSYKFPIVISGKRAHPDYKEGVIVDMTPPPGRVVKQTRQIRLFVSSGKAPIVVPDLIGRTKEQAEVFVINHGITIRVDNNSFSTLYPKGVVISQFPEPNTLLSSDEVITVSLSNGFPVTVSTQPLSASFFSHQHTKLRTHVQFEILKEWPEQQIVITYKNKKGKEINLYNKKHHAEDHIDLTYKLEQGGQLMIYFNGDIAYNDTIK
jgi:serine/threonine protein kinase